MDLDFTTRDGAAARVLLSLTNTGGKSTLITLVCSLVVPASRAQIGGKILGDYVLSGDTSHVVCEWEDATTGRRMVTGTVMEWKDGRRQPAHKMRSTTNMHRAWYLFRTGLDLPGIADLPYIVNGRRLPYKDFRAAVEDLIATHPDAHGILTDKQQIWTTALEQRTSIDPTLFGYQMRMNDSETGAEKLLASFDSPDNVVRFFVAALNDERELETFTSKLEAYSALAAERSTLESLAGFGAEISPMIDLIARKANSVKAAAAESQRARIQGGEHATALDNRVQQDQRAMVELTEAAESAAREAGKARYEYGQISDIRQQLLLEDARARVARTEELAELAKQKSLEAERIALAWQAVDAVIDLKIKREACDAAQTAYDTADAGLGPLRDATANAATNVTGRLDALVIEAKESAEAADDVAAEARDKVDEARNRETEALVSISTIDQALSGIVTQVDAAERARVSAITVGWLHDGERPDACLRRWQETRRTANQKAGQALERATAAEKVFDEVADGIDALDKKLVGLRSAAQSAEERLIAFDSDLAATAADETVRDLIGSEPGDGTALARVAGLAGKAANEADTRAAKHNAVAQAAQEELNHLDDTGTAPTGPDVLAVLAVLINARIGSVTGLNWIERNIVDPDSREDFIARNPDLAGGVIISDPRRFADGVELLTASNVHTKTPVTVVTVPTTTAPTGSTIMQRHVVAPHRATPHGIENGRPKHAGPWKIPLSRREGSDGSGRRRPSLPHGRSNVLELRPPLGSGTGDLESAAADAAGKVHIAVSRRQELADEQTNQRRTATEAHKEHKKQLGNAATADQHVTASAGLVTTTTEAEKAADRVPGLNVARKASCAGESSGDQGPRGCGRHHQGRDAAGVGLSQRVRVVEQGTRLTRRRRRGP